MLYVLAFLIICLLRPSVSDGETGSVVQDTRSANVNKSLQASTRGESEIIATAKHASESSTGLQFDENYKTLLSGESSASLEILNDSAEVDDDGQERVSWRQEKASKLDEYPLPAKDVPKKSGDEKLENVYKVPKSKTKKVSKSNMGAFRRPEWKSVINDFNEETFSHSTANESLSSSKNFFHAFTNLFDHFTWSTDSFSRISKPCLVDMKYYLAALKESKDWALKISDASGRYRGLYFFENDFWLGSKQFCYEINDKSHWTDKIPDLHFSVIKLLITMNQQPSRLLHIGQCLPNSCSNEDIITIMSNDQAAMTIKQTDTLLKVTEVRMVPGDYNILKEFKFYVFSTIICVTILLIIIATLCENHFNKEFRFKSTGKSIARSNSVQFKCRSNDGYEMNQITNNNNNEPENEIYNKHQNNYKEQLGMPIKLLLCFSASNAKAILSSNASSEDSLTCIHGLRFFSLMWTVLVHTYLQFFAVGENRFIRKISERHFFYQIVGNATFSVDTFFFISGLLVVLLFLKTEGSKKAQENRQNKESKIWKSIIFIFYRFLRLTPAYLMIIVFTELSMKIVYDGSVFTPGLVDHINCNAYWWRNILYINNFYPLHQMCLMWSWYLANDFQFYIIAIVILMFSTRYLKLSIVSSLLLLVISWIVTIYVSLHFKYVHKVSDPFESFDFLYDKPYQRFGPYAAGMITGYILYRTKEPPKVFQNYFVYLCLWGLSLFNFFIIIFGVTGGRLSVALTSLYVSFGHTAWGFSLMWICLSCCWGLSKPINSFLSFNGFLPLSRLTYCTYLIHPTVMMITSFQCESSMHLHHLMLITSFLGNAVISFLIAFIISMMFEAPIIRVLRVLRK